MLLFYLPLQEQHSNKVSFKKLGFWHIEYGWTDRAMTLAGIYLCTWERQKCIYVHIQSDK